jgi:hypothetical protein
VDRLPRTLATATLGAAMIAGIAGPYAYSINTAATPHTGSIVTAGPVTSFGGGGPAGRGAPGGMPPGQTSTRATPPDGTRGGAGAGGLLNGASASSELVTLLTTDATSYTWVAATVGAQNAASYQLATQDPVMAIGGFNGSDPSPTLEQFTEYVSSGRIHYFIANSLGGQQNGGSDAASTIAAWVADNYTATTVGGTTVYDLTQSK